MLVTYRSGIMVVKQGHNPVNGNIANITLQMIDLMAKFHQLGIFCKRSMIIMNPHIFGSFLRANHNVWLNNFFS